jgi:hypothetical protein
MGVILGPSRPGTIELAEIMRELNEQQLRACGEVDDRWTDIEIARRYCDVQLHDLDEAREHLKHTEYLPRRVRDDPSISDPAREKLAERFRMLCERIATATGGLSVKQVAAVTLKLWDIGFFDRNRTSKAEEIREEFDCIRRVADAHVTAVQPS